MTHESPPRGAILAALGATYIIWGSTYLAIRVALETIPPFVMAGTRFVVPGLILIAWTWLKGAAAPTRLHWRSALIIGALMPLGGSGGITWAEQRIPSGLAALIIGAVPLWVVVANWIGFGGTRPNRRMTLGLTTGAIGLALLIGPADIAGGSSVDTLGALVALAAALSWAVGSLYSRRASLPESPLLATGIELLAGGVLLYALGFASGEGARFQPDQLSLKSGLAVLYLALVGSLVAFSAYVWLLRHTTPARAASYAYVNPVIAVILGWALAGEDLNLRMIVAAAIIVGSVVLITSFRAQQGERARLKLRSDPPRAAEEAPSEAETPPGTEAPGSPPEARSTGLTARAPVEGR